MRRLLMFVALLATLVFSQGALAARPIVHVGALQPTWNLGVYSAYYGPGNGYVAVSPGLPAMFMGREAGIIKAGLMADTDNHYWDEGLFAFKPYVTIDVLAGLPLTYDVVNQYGTHPVWMTIEIDTGVVGDRDDNTTFQMVPPPYGSTAYFTVDAGSASNWLEWADNSGNTTGPPRTLNSIKTEYSGLNVVRAYLRLGMGDSYGPAPNGTQAWVDKASIAGVTYDFVVKGKGYTNKDWGTNRGNHGFKNP